MRKTILVILAAVVATMFAATPEARKAFREFERKAERGDAESQYKLGTILETGWDTVPADSVRALRMFRMSALQEYPEAMNYLGYLFGKGYHAGGRELVSVNPDSALYWLKRSADLDDPKAMANLAYLILNDMDALTDSVAVSRNDSAAWGYLVRSAGKGVPTAYSMMGDMYRDGRYVKRDTVRAAFMYETALSKGLTDVEARLISLMGPVWERLTPDEAFEYGIRYYDGYAPSAGTFLLKRAAVLPEVSEKGWVRTPELLDSLNHRIDVVADALTALGEAASLGKGLPYDHDKSRDYYIMGALAGSPEAQNVVRELIGLFPDTFSNPSDTVRQFSHRIALINKFLDRPIVLDN